MSGAARRALIRHLFYAEHRKIGTIAAQLGIRRDTVYRAIQPHRSAAAGHRHRPGAPLDDMEASHDPRHRTPFEVAP